MSEDRIYHNGRRFPTEGSPYYSLIARDDGLQVKWSCPCCGELYSRQRFATKDEAVKAIEARLSRQMARDQRPLTFFEHPYTEERLQ